VNFEGIHDPHLFFFFCLQIFDLLHMMEKRLFLGFCKLLLLSLDWNKKIILCLQKSYSLCRCADALINLGRIQYEDFLLFSYSSPSLHYLISCLTFVSDLFLSFLINDIQNTFLMDQSLYY
jgi:hypothetical protein